jgi:hypothetical protein
VGTVSSPAAGEALETGVADAVEEHAEASEGAGGTGRLGLGFLGAGVLGRRLVRSQGQPLSCPGYVNRWIEDIHRQNWEGRKSTTAKRGKYS